MLLSHAQMLGPSLAMVLRTSLQVKHAHTHKHIQADTYIYHYLIMLSCFVDEQYTFSKGILEDAH